MMQMIHVGSKSNATVVIPIEARGIDQTEARRTAIQFVRARHNVADPIALSEHEAAVRIRQQLLAKFSPKMPSMVGNSKPFWLQPQSRYGY